MNEEEDSTLPVDATAIRLFLHVTAATVWVGGQITLVALLPVLRGLGDDAPKRVARQFNRVAWPAFGVLIVTGIWNMVAVAPAMDGPYAMTLAIKLALVALSGVSAFLHSRTSSRPLIAASGAIGLMSALAAVFFGVQLG